MIHPPKPALACCLLVALAGSATTGCHAFLKPSDRERHSSFARSQELFTGDQQASLSQTYFVFAGDSDLPPPQFNPKTHRLVIHAKAKSQWSQGLAVAVAADGYLLTAGHVLGATNYVLGSFNGTIGLKPATVVRKDESKEHADLALIKVDGTLNHFATIGDKPQIGGAVFSVVCYQKNHAIGGNLGFAAGKVRNVNESPSPAVVALLDTSVPLWEGDSGGPLLSDTGQLLGITTGYVFDWYGVYWKQQRLSFQPDEQVIHDIIAHDRSRSHPAD